MLALYPLHLSCHEPNIKSPATKTIIKISYSDVELPKQERFLLVKPFASLDFAGHSS